MNHEFPACAETKHFTVQKMCDAQKKILTTLLFSHKFHLRQKESFLVGGWWWVLSYFSVHFQRIDQNGQRA